VTTPSTVTVPVAGRATSFTVATPAERAATDAIGVVQGSAGKTHRLRVEPAIRPAEGDGCRHLALGNHTSTHQHPSIGPTISLRAQGTLSRPRAKGRPYTGNTHTSEEAQ